MKKPNSISSRVFIALTFAINLICSSVVGSLYSYHNEFGNAYMKRQVTHETGQFLSQLNNLAGKPGEGYYVQVEIGTPKQTVRFYVDLHTNLCEVITKYRITCIQRPPRGSNKSGLLQQVVFKCRFY